MEKKTDSAAEPTQETKEKNTAKQDAFEDFEDAQELFGSLKINELHEKALKKCEAEMIEWQDKFFRTSADFHNYKKRIEKEQSVFNNMLKANLLLDILAIVDNFDRALGGGAKVSNLIQLCLKGLS